MSSLDDRVPTHRAYSDLLMTSYFAAKKELFIFYSEDFLIDTIHGLEESIFGLISYIKKGKMPENKNERISYIERSQENLKEDISKNPPSGNVLIYVYVLVSAAEWSLKLLRMQSDT